MAEVNENNAIPGGANAPEAALVQPTAPVQEETRIPEEPVIEIEDAEPIAASQEEAAIVLQTPSSTVEQEYPVFLPLDGGQVTDTDVMVSLPFDTIERSKSILEAHPNEDIAKTAHGAEWAYYAARADRMQVAKDWFQSTVNRPGSAWRQVVKSEKGSLGIASPVFKESTEGVKLTGEAAVLRVKSLMGMGSVVSVPLWHSGFWVTLKGPSEMALQELTRRITEEKILLGRMTYGLAYSNTSVFFAGAIMEFVLNHIYDTSLKNRSMENIRARLSSLDIPLLAWGLACVNWPRGFQYTRAVLTDNQGQMIREKLNVGKLLWTDTSQLSDWQRTHMSQRHGNNMTDESVDRYRNEFTVGRGRTVQLRDGLSVTLRVPSLDQYLNNGMRWVNNIASMADKAFGLTQEAQARDQYILDQGKATNFRQYGHWIESIQAGKNLIDHEETLDETADALSADDTVRGKFYEEVRKYMEDSTVAIVAVPSFFPEEQKLTMSKFPNLLPLDVLSTFFTLIVQKTEIIQQREL